MAYYQDNTLSIASRTLLAQLLAELIETCQAIEEGRQKLAALPFFQPLPLFRLLDTAQKGVLNERDLARVMGTSHRKLLTYAFSWIDVQKIGEVTRFEFACFLMPRDDLNLREACLRCLQEGKEEGTAALDMHFILFQQLLGEIMRQEMKVIELRRLIMANSDYSLEGVRSSLTNSHRSWVSANDFLTFLSNYGYLVTARDTERIVEALSSQGEGAINMQQLKWIIEGLENKEDRSYLEKVKIANKKKHQKRTQSTKKQQKIQINNIKQNPYPQNRQFQSLVDRFWALQREERRSQRKLIQSQKRNIESARKNYKKDLARLHLKREEDSMRKSLARQARLAQRQMEQQMEELLNKTVQLQEDSHRIIRQERRISVHEDSASIRKQLQAQLYAQEYERMASARTARKRLQFSPIKDDHRRFAIQAHIMATEQYLQNAQHLHQRILRERKQKSLIFQKENQNAANSKGKTPGKFSNKTLMPQGAVLVDKTCS